MLKHVVYLLPFAIPCLAVRAQTVDHPLKVGGDVLAPVLVKQIDPKYPKPIFAKPKTGEVLIGIVVDEQGIPQNIHIERSLDKKLDSAAVEAVKQYRFKPALKSGVPVAVQLRVTMSFQIF